MIQLELLSFVELQSCLFNRFALQSDCFKNCNSTIYKIQRLFDKIEKYTHSSTCSITFEVTFLNMQRQRNVLKTCTMYVTLFINIIFGNLHSMHVSLSYTRRASKTIAQVRVVTQTVVKCIK